MGIISYGLSDQGRVRKNNEDSFFRDDQLHLYIIADGMGGHLAGEVASNLGIETLVKWIQHNLDDNSPQESLKKGVEASNEAIFQKASGSEKTQGMGTTMVTLFFHGGHLYISSVGDSRAYLIHQGELFQLTKDHTFIQEKIHLGISNRDDAQKDPLKNVLVRTVGYEPHVEVDHFNYRVCKNDLFLLCSDGLHSFVPDNVIIEILQKNLPLSSSSFTPEALQKGVEELIRTANDAGGNDNVTVMLVATL